MMRFQNHGNYRFDVDTVSMLDRIYMHTYIYYRGVTFTVGPEWAIYTKYNYSVTLQQYIIILMLMLRPAASHPQHYYGREGAGWDLVENFEGLF